MAIGEMPPWKWSLIVLSVIAVGSVPVIIFFHPYAGTTLLADNQVRGNSGQVIPALPIHLKVPKINIDAAIEYVGLTPQGAMAVPKGPVDAAWFSLGPRPGEKGSAVIAGHDGWKNSIPAVFDNLYKLQKGDKISIEDAQGAVITFVVRELRTYGENQDASDVFFSNDGKAHLNLITCEGIWNKVKKSYSNRLVVFSDKE